MRGSKLIKFDSELQSYVDFLEKNYPCKEVVQLKPLYGFETVQYRDGDTGELYENSGFAVYAAHSKTIGLPMLVVEEILKEEPLFLLHNLAHEYKHFLDDVAGKT